MKALRPIRTILARAQGGLPIVILAAIAKGIAFIREPVVAAALGASAASDAYYIAVGLPLAIYTVLALPLSQWVTARLASGQQTRESSSFFTRMLWLAAAASTAIAVAVWGLASGLVHLYAPGLDGDRLSEAVALARIGALAIPALILQAVCAGRLYATRRFTTVYFWLAMGSLVGLAGVLTLTPPLGAAGAVYSFLAAWWSVALVLLALTWPVRRQDPLRSIPDDWNPATGQGVVARAIVLQVYFQGSAMLVYAFASGLSVGEIAATLFAGKVVMAVYETVVLTAGILVFPRIAKSLHRRDEASAGAAVLRTLQWVVPITVASMLVLAVSRTELVTLIYRRRAFDDRAVALVARALLGYAPYVVGITLVEILHRVMVLRGRIGGYAVIFGGALAANWALCRVLVPSLGVLGVSLGTSCGVLLAAGGLWVYTQRRLPQIQGRAVAVLIARTVAAAMIGLVVISWLRAWVPPPVSTGGQLLLLAGSATIAVVIFAGLLSFMGHPWPWLYHSDRSGAVS